MDIQFFGQFVESKLGKTGLTVTFNLDKIQKSNGTKTAVLTGVAATEGSKGYYYYRLASADIATYDYVGTFITATTTVDQREIPALWSRFSEGEAAASQRIIDVLPTDPLTSVTPQTLNVDASGNLIVSPFSTLSTGRFL